MCNHISIVLPNRPGELGRICGMLADQSINILGHQSASQGNSSIVHLLCEPHGKAYEVLRNEFRFYCNEKKVIIISTKHLPGEFGQILSELSRCGLNLESSYQALQTSRMLLVLELQDRDATEKAEAMLLKSHFSVLEAQPETVINAS